jgi:hypothetical protein
LNSTDDDVQDIPRLTPTKAYTTRKVALAKVVSDINFRGTVRANQRAARNRQTNNGVEELNRVLGRRARASSTPEASLSGTQEEGNRRSGTGDVIQVRPAQRRRTEASPSASAAARPGEQRSRSTSTRRRGAIRVAAPGGRGGGRG